MTTDLLNLFVAAMCVFLVGINIAFLIELRRKLVPWFNIKLGAVTTLLVYVGLSVAVGNPDQWRVWLAAVAVAVDLVAFVQMYSSVQRLNRSGVVGLIPLARYDADHGGAVLREHE